MAGKKWYSYFVVTEDSAAAGRPGPAASRRVDAVAPDAAAPAVAIDETAAVAGAIDEVYRSARIETPAHGYTVLKVAEMLRSEHIQALPPEVKRRSVLVALEAAGVSVDDIIQDAVRRDRALDAYERVLEKHLAGVRAAAVEENARIEAEIAQRVAELRARIDEHSRQVAGEEEELRAWRARKHQEELAIADAVGYFVSENPITGPPSPAAAGDADVR